MAAEVVVERRGLFGGMIEMSVPRCMQDISRVRLVPDHQEVFADAKDVVDRSLVVEILERDAHIHSHGEEKALRFHYTELAKANEAFELTLEGFQTEAASILAPNLNPTKQTKVSLASGTQKVSKYKEEKDAANDVHVCLALVSIPEHETDVLVTLNTPLSINPKSSSYDYVLKETNTSKAASSGVPLTKEEQKNQSINLFRTLVSSFRIVDYRLFGHE